MSTVNFINRNLDFAHRALTDAANGRDEWTAFFRDLDDTIFAIATQQQL
jgi:hypothetical protein